MAKNDDQATRMAAYEQRQAELEEMHAWYEASDHAEYVQYLDELDARDAELS
ncbi:hypothetical protein ACGFYY_32605 [Streptomyces sp. NPDC048331]|uniref:hypothetical protein n=1 Tax=Streptomyces sp. NPDC048331 TaxID=3365534 RepID=UPI00371D1FD7